MRARGGATMLELLVVVTVLGIAMSVVALGARPSPGRADRTEHDAIARLRSAALTRGRDTTTVLIVAGRTLLVTALRDGRTMTEVNLTTRESGDASR